MEGTLYSVVCDHSFGRSVTEHASSSCLSPPCSQSFPFSRLQQYRRTESDLLPPALHNKILAPTHHHTMFHVRYEERQTRSHRSLDKYHGTLSTGCQGLSSCRVSQPAPWTSRRRAPRSPFIPSLGSSPTRTSRSFDGRRRRETLVCGSLC